MSRRATLFAVFLAAVLAQGASAAKPPARSMPLPPGAGSASEASSLPSIESVCTLGITGPAVFSVDYLLPPDDTYYLRVRPRRCAGCPDSAGVWISSIQLTLNFPVACTMPVSFGLVRAKGDTSCAPPDPASLFCGPVNTNLVAASSGTKSFTLPLGQACPITRDVYLRIRFPAEGAGCAGDGMRPRLVTTASCTLCVAYNYYPSDSADLCALLLPGLPLISATADSCYPRALVAVAEPVPPPFSLRVSPNPTAGEVQIQLALARPDFVRLFVCDVAGRRVRTLYSGAIEAGARVWFWDGRDDRGERQRAGIYFVRVRSSRGEQTRTIVIER